MHKLLKRSVVSFIRKIFVAQMAPAYKLSYFPLTALGESIRFLLSYGGIEFEDCRIAKEDWPQHKPNMPFGQMPVLEYNGKKAYQSLAICKYLAKQVKLVGRDDWEDLEIDAVAFTVYDLRLKIAQYYYEQDEKVKERLKITLFNETLPYYLQRLDDIAKENNGHLAAGRLTWADLYFASFVDYINWMVQTDIFAKHQNLIAVKNNVLNLPAIKEWIEKRPKYFHYVIEMAPAYKLTYFSLTAVGESIRFLLSYGGIEFEDCRIDREVWPQYKPNMPFGQMPVLEHNGKTAHQSIAICKYLAKQVKLVGKDDWEDLEIDAVVFTVYDLVHHIAKFHYEQDESLKKKVKTTLFNEILPYYLERLDDIAKENNGHLAVGRLTWADLYFVSFLDYSNWMAQTDIIAKYQNLITVKNNVLNLPAIKEWIEKRPKGI